MRQVPIWKPLLLLLVGLLSLMYALPSLLGGVSEEWPDWLPGKVIHQGLDLQGGLYLLLHVHTDKAVEQASEGVVDEVRRVMREEKLRYRGVSRISQEEVEVKLSDRSDADAMRKVLSENILNTTLTEESATLWKLTLIKDEITRVRSAAVEQSLKTIRSRIDQFGVSEPTLQKQGDERILIQLPGLKDPARAKALIGRTARLEFKMVDDKGDLSSALDGRIPPGDMLLYGKSGNANQPYLLKKRTVMTGENLKDARVSYDQYNMPYVAVAFDRKGGSKFARVTGENVKKRMAIVLDGTVYSAPVIQEKIEGGQARITGSFSPEEAHDLAIVLRAGALPAPVTIMEERTVGPTLGQDSVDQGLISVLIGGALVLVFMILYYKGFGLVANLAVVVNVMILMAILAAMQATLTLPGIAGAVLLLGMSVDANVLIFERIREELRLGKSPLAAIDHGYNKAFSTIMDANITTLITAIVLFQFGTGPVRGFAVTLSIGLMASMFTAIFMTRVIIALYFKNRRPKALSI
ncbi:MAG: protein translocase subunit SecD [Magnetococcales bacterium]|nr:protein translocase subunit SecD [Magnetococcales bacterium]